MEKLSKRQNVILQQLSSKGALSISKLLKGLDKKISRTSFHRDLTVLKNLNYIKQVGEGRTAKYELVQSAKLILPIDLKEYFYKGQDDRNINEMFNFDIFDELSQTEIFFVEELKQLGELNSNFHENLTQLSETIIQKEFERITIELSWKSSSIEGNTYSLLETESLLKDGQEAEGKKKEEAIMLLNHKKALDYIRANAERFKVLKVSDIDDIHKILVKDLDVAYNVRKTLVGITGTNFKPIDNDSQIYEALEKTCVLINNEENTFVKAFYALCLLAYIQPFEDGNKRTSRFNAEYKLATLLFYEVNNVSALKELFLEQAGFAGGEYFRVRAL